VGPQPGILDWYTILAGVIAFVALTMHGAHYIALKTAGELNVRTLGVALVLWPILTVLTIASLFATIYVRPEVLSNFRNHPVGFVIPIAVAGSLGMMLYALRSRDEWKAFLGSSAYLISMLVGAAFAIYPTLLPSSTDPAYSLTIYNSAAGPYALSGGIIWWTAGMAIAIGYFVFIYRMFRGKVSVETGGHGY
jgi:cytochrome d ubiquinol oxidase subunit II